MMQGMQGQGNSGTPSESDLAKMGQRDASDDGQSYEPPTQQFDKLDQVRSTAPGAKSTTTGQSLFGGQSSDQTSEPHFSINEHIDRSRKQNQQL